MHHPPSPHPLATNTAARMDSKTPITFLDLPVEIRIRVYRYCGRVEDRQTRRKYLLPTPITYHDTDAPALRLFPSALPALWGVNKLVHDEYNDAYFSDPEITMVVLFDRNVELDTQALALRARVPLSAIKRIRRAELRITEERYTQISQSAPSKITGIRVYLENTLERTEEQVLCKSVQEEKKSLVEYLSRDTSYDESVVWQRLNDICTLTESLMAPHSQITMLIGFPTLNAWEKAERQHMTLFVPEGFRRWCIKWHVVVNRMCAQIDDGGQCFKGVKIVDWAAFDRSHDLLHLPPEHAALWEFDIRTVCENNGTSRARMIGVEIQMV